MTEYERAKMTVTEFDQEDIITTSGQEEPQVQNIPDRSIYEMFYAPPGNWY